MPKLQGIVMKTRQDSTIIYTAQGDFLQVPTPKIQPYVGEIIEANLKTPKIFKPTIWKLASVAAVLLLILSLTLFNVLSIPQTAAASVVLDYSQSVVLQVDKDAKVIQIQNPHGDNHVIPGGSLKGMDIYQAVEIILSKAGSANLMTKNSNLVLASVIPLNSAGSNVVDTDKLRSSIQAEMLQSNMFGEMMVTKTDPGALKKAAQMGMSVNEYLIYTKLTQSGEHMDPNALSDGNIPDMLAKTNTSLESLFPQESYQIKPQTPLNNQAGSMDSNGMGSNPYGQPGTSGQMGGMRPKTNLNTGNNPAQPGTSMPNGTSPEPAAGMNSMNGMGK